MLDHLSEENSSSEFKLLLDFLLGKRRFDFADRVNWTDLNEYSNSLRALLFSLLSSSELQTLPSLVASRLKQVATATDAKNKKLLKLAEELNQVLQKDKLFFKGIVFLKTIYANNISARNLRDLDIIVPVTDYQATKDLLLKLGFIEDYNDRGLGTNEEAQLWFAQNHFHSVFKRNNLELELHKSLSYKLNSKILEQLFNTSTIFENYRIPSPEFLVLSQLLNFIHDQTLNLNKSWFLEKKAKSIVYAFIVLCFEVGKIYQHFKVDSVVLRQLILDCGETKKVSFLLNIIQKFNAGSGLDPFKVLVCSNVLFEKQKFLRFLSTFASIKPRSSPTGKAIYWLNCVKEMLLFPAHMSRYLLKSSKL